jgi:hypothetical protein
LQASNKVFFLMIALHNLAAIERKKTDESRGYSSTSRNESFWVPFGARLNSHHVPEGCVYLVGKE